MTSFPIPRMLDSLSGDKYRVLRRCGGSVFLALNITYGDDGEDARAWKDGKGTGLVAVKFEPKIVEHYRLAYNSLVGGPGIPFVHYSGSTEHYRYIILDLLGPSLEDMFEFCDRKFTLKTILLIADQALSRIEYIHSQSCAHRDVKAENFVIGLGTFSNLLHLINIGSANYPDAHLDAGNVPSKLLPYVSANLS
jgi:casein kinase I family protein HRR25